MKNVKEKRSSNEKGFPQKGSIDYQRRRCCWNIGSLRAKGDAHPNPAYRHTCPAHGSATHGNA